MDEVILAAYIAGFFTIFGAVAGTVISYMLVTLKERNERIKNQNRLMVELLELRTTFVAIKSTIEDTPEIKSSTDLFWVNKIWTRAAPVNLIKRLKKLFMESIIIDIDNSPLYARIIGVQNLTMSFDEDMGGLKKLDVLPDIKHDFKQGFIEESDLIIETIDDLIDEIYDIQFSNRVKHLFRTTFLKKAYHFPEKRINSK
jgi:hypothetical protein